MKILYLGDIMGEPGIKVVKKYLTKIKKDLSVDLVIAQAENLSNGKGILPKDFKRIRQAGVDFCTGGNWSLNLPEINSFMEDPNEPIIRPANYPKGTPGLGWKYVDTKQGRVLVISLLGQIVGKDAKKEVDNPRNTRSRVPVFQGCDYSELSWRLQQRKTSYRILLRWQSIRGYW